MPNLVGIGNSQAPTNAMLGGLAYQDPSNVNLESFEPGHISKIKAVIAQEASGANIARGPGFGRQSITLAL